MSRYKLHCTGASGNSYKVPLFLNCAGLDWEPVGVDLGAGRHVMRFGGPELIPWNFCRKSRWLADLKETNGLCGQCIRFADITGKSRPLFVKQRLPV
jgi:hypothetical protein